MAKPNFSHFRRITPESVVRSLKRGKQPTDDMLSEAMMQIDPPLLDRHAMRSLALEIDPEAERRGRRPNTQRSRAQLVIALGNVDRPDVSRRFLESLIKRLKSGNCLTEQQRSIRAHQRIERVKRGMLAASFYSQIRELMDPKSHSVTHPILGTHAIGQTDAPLRDKVLTITNKLLFASGDIGSISNDRLKNFISEYRTGKLHQIS